MSNLAINLPPSLAKDNKLKFIPFTDTDDKGGKLYRDGMSGLSASVNVVTTMVDGKPVGFTATAVASVTDAPPTLMVCLNRSSSVFSAFEQAETLCVNILAAGQEAVAAAFASKLSQAERFDSVDWKPLLTGSPALNSASTVFDCRISSRVSVGTHDVFFCEVVGVGQAQQTSNLVYFNRQYHDLS